MELKSIIDLAKTYQDELPLLIPPKVPQGKDIAGWIDHTILKPEATEAQITKVCEEAVELKFASVCIHPVHVPLAVEVMQGSNIPVCTVVGFPYGATSTASKAAESKLYLKDGATELDMVLQIGLMKSGKYQAVYEDVLAVVEATHPKGGLVKVILEMCYLDEFEKILACLLCKIAGAYFVKTSTGFASGGATVEDIRLMRSVVGPPEEMGVKAAGGIRSLSDAKAMIEAGANRIGSSAGVQIVADA